MKLSPNKKKVLIKNQLFLGRKRKCRWYFLHENKEVNQDSYTHMEMPRSPRPGPLDSLLNLENIFEYLFGRSQRQNRQGHHPARHVLVHKKSKPNNLCYVIDIWIRNDRHSRIFRQLILGLFEQASINKLQKETYSLFPFYIFERHGVLSARQFGQQSDQPRPKTHRWYWKMGQFPIHNLLKLLQAHPRHPALLQEALLARRLARPHGHRALVFGLRYPAPLRVPSLRPPNRHLATPLRLIPRLSNRPRPPRLISRFLQRKLMVKNPHQQSIFSTFSIYHFLL